MFARKCVGSALVLTNLHFHSVLLHIPSIPDILFQKKQSQYVHTIFSQKRLGVKWYKNNFLFIENFPGGFSLHHDLVWPSLQPLSSVFKLSSFLIAQSQYKWYKAKCHTQWQVCRRKPPLKAHCAECAILGGNLLSLLTLLSGLSAGIGTLKLAAP